MKRRQKGLTTVEFALAGSSALVVLFGCIEISRALYVWNTVGEATRRAARMAAICPMNDPAIRAAALFASDGDSRSPVLHGLEDSMVAVAYTDEGGAVAASVADVAYVTVSVTGYTHTLAIPFFGATIAVPAFSTTVPSETLGYHPDLDAFVCIESNYS